MKPSKIIYICSSFFSKMQGALWTFVGLTFILGQVYCLDASNEDGIHSPKQLNGTEGKVTTLITHIPKNKIPAENCICQWLKNNKTIKDIYGRFKYYEDRSTGKFSMEINSTQRNDTGCYKNVCCDAIESQETFLNIIEIPSNEYPTIELEVNNGLLMIYFITEKLSPIPELTLNEEKHILYKNATHFWIKMIVPMTNKTYVGVLQLKGYYRRVEAIDGPKITEYLNKIADESPDEEDTPTNEKENSTSSAFGLEIAGVTVGVIIIIACLCISIYFLIKSLRNKKTDGPVTYTAVSGQVSII